MHWECLLFGGGSVKLPRRQFLHLAAGAAALPAASRFAWAQTYPSRPVQWIVCFSAGGDADFTARLIGQWLSERLGQQFVIDNRPGGGTNIGTEAVVRASPDGYTLLMEVVTGIVLSSALYSNLNYEFMRDITPIARLGEGAYVMVVNSSVPADSLPQFIAYAKANPGKVNMASAGSGGPTHVFGELFKMMAGIEILHVPYRGSFLSDLLGGQVQLVFGPISQLLEYIRAGKLRALAVTTANRQTVLPDIPAVPCPGTRRAHGTESARPRALRARSSARSTARSTRRSPIRR